jgi:hypothetical protein
VNLTERRRVEPIEALTAFLPAPHEPDLQENGKVLRDCRVRETGVLDQSPNTCFASREEIEQPTPVCIGDGVEDIDGGCSPTHDAHQYYTEC